MIGVMNMLARGKIKRWIYLTRKEKDAMLRKGDVLIRKSRTGYQWVCRMDDLDETRQGFEASDFEAKISPLFFATREEAIADLKFWLEQNNLQDLCKSIRLHS